MLSRMTNHSTLFTSIKLISYTRLSKIRIAIGHACAHPNFRFRNELSGTNVSFSSPVARKSQPARRGLYVPETRRCHLLVAISSLPLPRLHRMVSPASIFPHARYNFSADTSQPSHLPRQSHFVFQRQSKPSWHLS